MTSAILGRAAALFLLAVATHVNSFEECNGWTSFWSIPSMGPPPAAIHIPTQPVAGANAIDRQKSLMKLLDNR